MVLNYCWSVLVMMTNKINTAMGGHAIIKLALYLCFAFIELSQYVVTMFQTGFMTARLH